MTHWPTSETHNKLRNMQPAPRSSSLRPCFVILIWSTISGEKKICKWRKKVSFELSLLHLLHSQKLPNLIFQSIYHTCYPKSKRNQLSILWLIIITLWNKYLCNFTWYKITHSKIIWKVPNLGDFWSILPNEEMSP